MPLDSVLECSTKWFWYKKQSLLVKHSKKRLSNPPAKRGLLIVSVDFSMYSYLLMKG